MAQPSAVVRLEDAGLATISLSSRVPEFWTDQPRVWFIQFEAVIAPQKMGDASKYNLVIAKLSKDVVQQVTDILVNPPEENRYETLKRKLLAIYEESESRQVQKLVSEMELGDQKPSHLLRKMQDLARNRINDETLSVLWQNHLPAAVRGVLAATEAADPERLAKIADKVMESMKPAAVAEVVDRGPTDSTAVLAEIAKLSARLDQLSRTRTPRGRRRHEGFRGRSQSRGRDGSIPRRTPDSPDWLCRYHFRFKHRATRCEQPCSWKSKPEN